MVAIGVPGPKSNSAGAKPGGYDQGGGDPDKDGDYDNDNSGEDCVSLSSLAMPDPDHGDQMANPAVGDRVTYTVEGTVTRIEGDEAYVKRESVNGQPVQASGSDDQDENEDQQDQNERDELGGMASQMGGMS